MRVGTDAAKASTAPARGEDVALILNNGSVFLHVPKTGGSWVTSVLHDAGLVQREATKMHADLDRFAMWIASKNYRPGGRFLFCFVRNPVTWYESWFRFMSQPGIGWRDWGAVDSGFVGWHPNVMLNGVAHGDFDAFVRDVMRRRPGYATEMMGWYTKPSISFVGRQETLRDDLIEALGRTGIRIDEDRVRSAAPVLVSDAAPVVWDPKLKEEMARLEYAGLVRYGYSLEETLER